MNGYRSGCRRLADRLRDRLISGDETPDRSIRQDDLASELGVSKIPIREALARLEEEGLVSYFPNRGYFVRALTRNEATEIFALRLKLEPGAVSEGAKRASAEEQKLAAALLDMSVDGKARSALELGLLNRRFHLALAGPCRQPVTLSILERLLILSERYVRKHLEPLGRDARAASEHRAILDAWIRRDAQQVRSLARAHIRRTLADLLRQLGPSMCGPADAPAALALQPSRRG